MENAKKEWKINKEGIELYKEKSSHCGTGKKEIAYQDNNQIFERTINGFKVTQYIDFKDNHGVILIEGLLFDSGSITKGNTIEEMSDIGFKNVETGILNLFVFVKELVNEKYIDNFDIFPISKTKNLNGIKIIPADEFFRNL